MSVRGKSLWVCQLLAVASVVWIAVGTAMGEERRTAAEYYNEGHRLYGLKLYTEATEAFRLALVQADDAEMRARVCHNLGNTYFKQAEATVSQNKDAALEFFGVSALAFRTALHYDEEAEDAAWNLELARRRESDLRAALESEREREGEEAEGQEGEGEESADEGDESGEELDTEGMEDAEESGAGTPSDYSASDLALDLESEGLPPPMLEPEDIFNEEAANRELREKKGQSYHAVEKDW